MQPLTDAQIFSLAAKAWAAAASEAPLTYYDRSRLTSLMASQIGFPDQDVAAAADSK